ncbi:MAG: hypothetical protein WCY53_07375 [Sphaerochaetaceae bacterium]|jgi:hypothetical protein
MKKPYTFILILLVIVSFNLFGAGFESNTTLSGINGYVVVPSALPAASGKDTSITTGYSAIFTLPSGFAHIPYIQFGFANNFEASAAVDITDDADLLVNAKWRFLHKGETSVALGLNGQLLDMKGDLYVGGKIYVAATFSSTFITLPSKTTVMLGYSIDKNSINSDIDFGMGFQAPFFPKVFKEKVDFLIDFGNVSYSNSPSGGDAENRGMLNLGLRLLPLQFMRGTYFATDLRLIDIFDAKRRAFSVGAAITFVP